ncbi:hypothetical protein IW145_001996 [Coemansia sp. RSA 521]|nr:hypothetical protein IW145_001996 [Coemansia sp. RSA 521]KAJ2281057.1 hypothetical protein GGH14_002122 [Coemansia sp. RSA 370]
MGKSAKAFKRPTKKQKEIKKTTKAQAALTPAADKERPSSMARTSSGGVSKSKSIRKKAKVASVMTRASKAKKRRMASEMNIAGLLVLTVLLFAVPGLAAPGVIDDIYDWVFSGAMLSEPRSSVAATSVGNIALFAGGRLQNGSYSDVVDIYNRKSKTWTVSRLSVARSEIGAGSVGNRYALFAGGFDSSFKPMTLVDVFDAQTGQWSQIQLNTPRAAPRLLDLGSVVAVVGGLSGDLQYLSKAVDYVDANLTVHSTSLPSEYPQLGLPIFDSTSGIGLYTAGYQNSRPGERFNDFEPSNQTTIFAAASASLVAGPLFPYPRWGSGGAAANGMFVVGGGHMFGDGSSEPLTTVTDRADVFHAQTQQWGQALTLSVPRDYPLVQTVGDYVVFLAGTQATKALDIFDSRTGTFIVNPRHTPALYTLRDDAAAVTVDGCLLMVAGGTVYQGRNATASVEIFDACKS